jgi:sec-independent protein translocase protein TatB
MIAILGLLLFGPRKLPQIGRTVGKAVSEFRRATTDFKMNLEREVDAVDKPEKPKAAEVDGAVARKASAPTPPESASEEPHEPAKPADPES